MTRRMLIDATHHEETRVVVLDGNRLTEFDYESKVRKQLKGNIFLAKVTRVEPSLQAAFVNFGGNRHGFLPFAEIHPDYYRIPVADREALMAEQRQMEEEAAAREAAEEAAMEAAAASGDMDVQDFAAAEGADDAQPETAFSDEEYVSEPEETESGFDPDDQPEEGMSDAEEIETSEEQGEEEPEGQQIESGEGEATESGDVDSSQTAPTEEGRDGRTDRRGGRRGWRRGGRNGGGGRRYMGARGRRDEVSENGPGALHARFRRRYKIQEVIKRGQIMLVQVAKEERGNKGAAVTTYLSLPGRYCVLMPNSPRGGGVSRKVADMGDRRRLKEILNSLSVPSGMSVILRTAGVARQQEDIQRDYDYLLQLWDGIRGLTLKSTAPAQIYEEGDLIKRSIRDIYSSDIDEIVVAGQEGQRETREFMQALMPGHDQKIKEYGDEKIPLFQRYQVEDQITAIGEPIVQLKSGGYIVISPTEALVSIDVNSGRATRERHIEETALKTNLEAAEEVARQLRLRDLGGLVVIDFIDMEDRRNNMKVERRLKDALANDRARIQVNRISSFGLLEMSRQRLNPSLTEAQFRKCPHCEGFGFVRTADSAAIIALRALEEEGVRDRAAQVILHVPTEIALYILNEKRERLSGIEQRYGFTVLIRADETLAPSRYRVEPVKAPIDDDEAEGEEEESETQRRPRSNQGRNDRRGGRFRDREVNNTAEEQSGESVPESVDDDAQPVPSENDANDTSEDIGNRRAEDDGTQEDHGNRRDNDDRPRRGRYGQRGGRGRGGRDRDRPERGDRPPRRERNEDARPAREQRNETTEGAPAPEQPSALAEKPKATYFVSKRRTSPAASAEQGVSETTTADETSLSSGTPKKGWWNRFGGNAS